MIEFGSFLRNKSAVMRHRVRAFMFAKGNYQGVEYAAALIVGRAQVINLVRKTAGPFFARVLKSGEVDLLEPRQEAKELTSRERTARKYGANVLKT